MYEEASRGPDLISSRGQCFPLQHTLWRPAAAQTCLYRAQFTWKRCWQNVRHLKMITLTIKVKLKGQISDLVKIEPSFYHINTGGAALVTCSTYEKQSWNFSLFIFLPLMKMSPKSVPAFPIRPATASSSVVFPEPENRKNTLLKVPHEKQLFKHLQFSFSSEIRLLSYKRQVISLQNRFIIIYSLYLDDTYQE